MVAINPHHNLYYVISNTWDLRALQAVLLSGIAKFFVSTYSTKMRGGSLRFQAQYLRHICIPQWLKGQTCTLDIGSMYGWWQGLLYAEAMENMVSVRFDQLSRLLSKFIVQVCMPCSSTS